MLPQVIASSKRARGLRRLIRYYYQVEKHMVGAATTQPVPARSPQAFEFTFGMPYQVHPLVGLVSATPTR